MTTLNKTVILDTHDLSDELAAETSMLIDGRTITFAALEAQIVIITPEDAERILSRNVRNRKITSSTLNKIVADLRGDNFEYNGSSIVFSCEGKLLDGQNRLSAVVKTGHAIMVIIATGVRESAQGKMDSGTSRTLSHQLGMNGEQAAPALAAVLVAVQAWERGVRSHDGSSDAATISASLDFFARNQELRALSREATNTAAKLPGLTAKQVSLFTWVFDKLSRDDRRDFFAKLASGANLADGHPILVLRNTLIADKASNTKLTSYTRMAITALAWNAYRENRTVRTLRFTAGGKNPQSFPEPV